MQDTIKLGPDGRYYFSEAVKLQNIAKGVGPTISIHSVQFQEFLGATAELFNYLIEQNLELKG